MAKKYVVAKGFHEKKGNKNLYYRPERPGRAVIVEEKDFEAERWKELVDGGFVKPADKDAVTTAGE